MARGWFRPITPSRDEPVELDTSVAHIARMQNYWRGGKDNFAADRAAAEHAMAADPIVLAHSRALLASSAPGSTSYVDADVRDTSRLLEQAAAALDFSAPVAVILVSVLHMIQDHDDPNAIVNRLMDAVPPGSFLVLTHVASDLEPEAMAEMARRVNQHVAQPTTPRDYATVARFFADLELVPPGVVRVPEWRPTSPEAAAAPSTQWGGVGRKR